MKTTFSKYVFIVALIAGVLLFLWIKGCDRNSDDGTVIIPPIDGEFEPQKPIYVDRTDTVYVTRWRTKTDTIEIETENPVNDSLAIAYQKALDSIDRYKMFLDAIQIRNFENIFEDDTIKITVTGEVQGQLNWLKPIYHIKEREIDVPVTRLRLLAGGEVGGSTSISNFQYKLNLGLQNKKGDIYRLGYARQHSEDIIWVGFDFSILNLKW